MESFDQCEHKLIGSGSSSHIYKWGDLAYKKYAQYCIRPKYLSVDFIKEVAITKHLQACPYIIKICDTFVSESKTNVGYTMKKYAGTITDKKFEPGVAQKIMHQLLTAVEHAHANSIIHGDIKPCNILIDNENNIVLADWGLAISKKYNVGEPKDLDIQTFNYRAPEIFAADAFYGCKIDIWSCGLVLFSLICGAHFIRWDTATNFIAKIVYLQSLDGTNYDSDPKFNLANKFYKENGGNTSLCDLLFKMLEIDPKKRITACEALEHPYFDNLRCCDHSEEANTIEPQCASNVAACEQNVATTQCEQNIATTQYESDNDITQCEQARIFTLFLSDFKEECKMSEGTFAIATNILAFVLVKMQPLQKDVMKWSAAIAYLACGANEPKVNRRLFDYTEKYDIDHATIFDTSLKIFKEMDYDLY